MNTPASRIIVVLIIGGLVGLSCTQTPPVNRAPTITALNLPDSTIVGNEETFQCTASDPDGDALAYNWTCSSGAIASASGSAVIWTAPFASGVATIAVMVQDSSGASDTSSGTVTINPITTTIVDWYGAVAAGDARIWTSTIPANYSVSGSFSVAGQDITFLMLDAYNYQRWRNDSSYTAVVKVERSAGSDFTAVVDTIATFYNFVLDNTYNVSADTTVHLFVQSTSP
jgi:hypothetical protein